MKIRIFRGTLSLLLALVMTVSLLAGLSLTASADYAYNSGVRGVTCTSLSSAALSYWSGDYAFATLNAQSGDTLRATLRTKINSNRTTVGYGSYNSGSPTGLVKYFPYTDCYQGDTSKVTLFYANRATSSAWNANSYWNREHMWPDSLGGNAVEGDLHSMRPTDSKANSTRGNSKYANVRELYPDSYKTAVTNASNGSVTAGYYYSNTYFEPLDASKGDAARVLLYDYIVATSMSSPTVAIKDIQTLLDWCALDPVDEYEMQRNDIVQSIQGCRNPFVDYPELAWRLFTSYTMPSDMVTPSGTVESFTVSASTNNSSYGTVSVNGYVITASPANGYYASGYTVTSGTASVSQNGNTFTVTPSSNCTVRIDFAAKQTVTVTFSANGETSTQTGYTGEAMSLTSATAPSGYTFVGWVTSAVAETPTRPATIYTTTYTPTTSCTLYALYSHSSSSGSGTGDYVKVTSASDLTGGQYLIVNEDAGRAMDASKESSIGSGTNYIEVTISNSTIASTATVDASAFTYDATAGTFATPGGLYIYRNSGSSGGSVLTTSTATDAANTITFSSGDATVTCNSNYMLRYNSQGYFRYYVSGQSAVQLYKKDGSASSTTYMTTIGGSTTCEHSYTSVVTAPTCTTAGYTTYTCTKCGDTYTGDTVAALGHSYGSFSSNNNGTHSKTCSRCGDVATESCAYTTSTSGATTTFTCTVCAYSYTSTANTYTVTYNDRGSTTSVSCIDGNSVTLPATASTVEGYTFSGWVTATIATETTSKPTVLTGSYTPTANVTLYACYARTEAGSGTSSLVRMTAGNTLSDGDQLVIVADGTTVALYQETVSSSYVNTYTFDSNVSTVLADAKNYLTVNVNNDGFTLGDSTNGYLNSSNNNLYCNSTEQTWTLSDLGDGTFKLQSDGRNLSYRSDLTSNPYWRMGGKSYGTSGNTILRLYKITSGGASTTYYTTSPTVSEPEPAFVSAAPILNRKIDMVYTVSVPSGYSNPYMVFTFNGTTSTVTDYTTESGNLKFTFTGVNPQCMGDTITATLYATKNDATVSVSNADYSVRSYCVNMLARNDISASLRTLLSDMLAYGAAAQTYMNYKTTALVTSGSDLNNPTYSTFSNLSGNAASFDGDMDADYCWISAGLTLTDSVAMNFRFHAASVSGLTVYVSLGDNVQTYTEFTSVGNGAYEVSFTGISAEQFGDTVTAVMEADSEQVGNELSYTVNAYVQSKQADSNTALQALVKALYNYGVAAAAYAG